MGFCTGSFRPPNLTQCERKIDRLDEAALWQEAEHIHDVLRLALCRERTLQRKQKEAQAESQAKEKGQE